MSVPDADVLIQIAELLDVPVSQLLGIEPESGSVQDMAGELARLNKELAAKIQKEKLRAELDKKRGVILLLSFGTLIAALTVKSNCCRCCWRAHVCLPCWRYCTGI